MNLITGGLGTLGYNLDGFTGVFIGLIVVIMALLIIFSKMSLKTKFKLTGTPLSIIFFSIIVGLLVRTFQSSPIHIKLVQ
tara:strand:+ start:132 stop:371 length:240 start_codon:yes stop_codon:yes gene_type:complete